MSKLLQMMHERGIPISSDDNETVTDFVRKIPEAKHRLADLELGVLLNGAWQTRKVIMTKELISFALVGEDTQVDHIPLEEINYIKDMSLRKESLVQWDDHGVGFYTNSVQIRTTAEGHNSGRTYCIKMRSREESATVQRNLQKWVKGAKQRARGNTILMKYQYKVSKVSDSNLFQGVMAFFIMANFIVTVVESQYLDSLTNDDGSSTQFGIVLDDLNIFFTFLFTAELLVNAFAHWLYPFISSLWNWVDIFVVLLSLSSIIFPDEPTGIVRIIRALRVIRIFGRLKSLKKIIGALSTAVIPVVNVFVILFLLISIGIIDNHRFQYIYFHLILFMAGAIVGVTLFRELDPDDFNQFSNAFLTMFHVTAGDPWPETLPKLNPDGSVNTSVALFMTGYTILVNWVILQVSVAVLLDNFISASAQIEQRERLERENERQRERQTKEPMEPLFLKLAKEYTDDDDLSERLRKLYKALDTDGSGGLSSQEFCAAIKKLDFKPRIHISDSDFKAITQNGALCDEQGQLGPKEFEEVMRKEILRLTQARLSLITTSRSPADADFMQYGTLKTILLEQLKMASAQQETKRQVDDIASFVRSLQPPARDKSDTGFSAWRNSGRDQEDSKRGSGDGLDESTPAGGALCEQPRAEGRSECEEGASLGKLEMLLERLLNPIRADLAHLKVAVTDLRSAPSVHSDPSHHSKSQGSGRLNASYLRYAGAHGCQSPRQQGAEDSRGLVPACGPEVEPPSPDHRDSHSLASQFPSPLRPLETTSDCRSDGPVSRSTPREGTSKQLEATSIAARGGMKGIATVDERQALASPDPKPSSIDDDPLSAADEIRAVSPAVWSLDAAAAAASQAVLQSQARERIQLGLEMLKLKNHPSTGGSSRSIGKSDYSSAAEAQGAARHSQEPAARDGQGDGAVASAAAPSADEAAEGKGHWEMPYLV